MVHYTLKDQTLEGAKERLEFLVGIEKAAIASLQAQGHPTLFLNDLLAKDTPRLAEIERYRAMVQPGQEIAAPPLFTVTYGPFVRNLGEVVETMEQVRQWRASMSPPSLFDQYAIAIRHPAVGGPEEKRAEAYAGLLKRGFNEVPLRALGNFIQRESPRFYPTSARSPMLAYNACGILLWAVDPEGKGLLAMANEFSRGEELVPGYDTKARAVFMPREGLDERRWGYSILGGAVEFHYVPGFSYHADSVTEIPISEFISTMAKRGKASELRKDLVRLFTPSWLKSS